MTMTQPVKIRRFKDEYDQGITKGTPVTPLEAENVLRKKGLGKEDKVLDSEEQMCYNSLTAVMLHMMRWYRVEIMNAVRECSGFMSEAKWSHIVALQRIMTYCVKTRDWRLTLSQNEIWNGTKDFVFKIRGMSDAVQ